MSTENTTLDTEQTIIDRSLQEFKEAGVILKNNQTRAQKAVAIGLKIIADFEAAGKKMSPELDERMQKYLVNCSAAKTAMNADRKAITQTLTMIAKAFTSEENKLDAANSETVAYQLQQIRNSYVKQLHEAEQKRLEELRVQQAKDNDAINIKAFIKKQILVYVGNYTSTEKMRINTAFNALTLENFNERSAKLKAMVPLYPYAHFQKFLEFIMLPNCPALSREEAKALIVPTMEPEYDAMATEYKTQVSELQNFLIDRLPSKKQELLTIKQQEEEMERERLAQERIRKEQETANAKRKLELEAERKASEERQRLAKIEQDRIDAEKRQREEEEAQRIAAEELQRKNEQEAAIDQAKEVETMTSLFSSEVESAEVVGVKPEARLGYEIEVLGAPGWMQIFQLWFTDAGSKLDNEKIAGTKMVAMKTFCEKQAHMDENKNIASNFLKYNPSFKAVNRKAK